MWGEVLGLAFLVGLNPMLLVPILLVISRPRPVQNLLAFWVGCLIVNIPSFMIPLLVLHLVPTFATFAQDMVTADPESGVKPFQLGTGLLALLVAVLLAVRLRMRQRAPQPAPTGAGGDSSVLVLDSDTPAAGSGLVAKVRSAIARLLRRGQDAWEGGALWVSVVFGMGCMPPPPLVLLVCTMIVGSGVPVATQVVAVMAFIIGMLAVFEVALLSYVVAPRRTEAVLVPVHNWSRAHRSHILIALLGVIGAWQVITGVGVL